MPTEQPQHPRREAPRHSRPADPPTRQQQPAATVRPDAVLYLEQLAAPVLYLEQLAAPVAGWRMRLLYALGAHPSSPPRPPPPAETPP